MPEAPALVIEKQRLQAIRPGQFLGIIGDASHTYGYHLENPPASDYSRAGTLNQPVGNYACAIDIGMNWPAARDWLTWFIAEVREDRITGIAEVIGSYDGKNVRYWSDSSGWQENGVAYTGTGHDTWTHVAIYRATALTDHRILAGWTATGQQGTGGTTMGDYTPLGPPNAIKISGVVRGDSVLLADQWGHEMLGHSPYGGPTDKSFRGRQLEEIQENVKRLLDRDTFPLELQDADIVAIADQVADRLSATLGKAATAAAESAAANAGVQQLLSRPTGAVEITPEQMNAIIDGVADRVGGLIAKAVADELAHRLNPDIP